MMAAKMSTSYVFMYYTYRIYKSKTQMQKDDISFQNYYTINKKHIRTRKPKVQYNGLAYQYFALISDKSVRLIIVYDNYESYGTILFFSVIVNYQYIP